MAQDTAWGRLGWQGIALDVPADWCPGQLRGTFASGYLRVEDEVRVRLELRWETLGRRAPSASALVDNYLRQTQRKLRRGEPTPQIVRHLAVSALEPQDHEAFIWRGGFHAHSLMAVCGQTRRLVHLRVLFPAGKERKGLSRRIFASLVTAPQDGRCEWSVFDLAFRLDASWGLETSALRTGCLRLAFRDGRDELEVSRFSLAAVTLRKESLRSWFARSLAKPLRPFRWQVHEEDYRGHAGLRCEGVTRASSRPLGFLRRPRYLTALAWHCPEADRLFVVRAVAGRAADPRVRACADTVACHEGGTGSSGSE